MRARRAAREDRRARGLDRDDVDVGVAGLEVATHAGDGTAGAHACDEDVDRPIGVLPDLGAGRGLMGGGVGRVGELAGDPALRRGCRQLFGACDSALHARGARGEDELGTVGGQEGAALGTHGLGHGDDQAVATRGGQRGEAHAGIAARGLDDGVAVVRCDAARRLGLVQHVERYAVLDGAGGILALELDEDARVDVGLALELCQLQQGGVSDQLVDGCVDGTHGDLLT